MDSCPTKRLDNHVNQGRNLGLTTVPVSRRGVQTSQTLSQLDRYV